MNAKGDGKIKIAVVGGSGYTGQELLRLLYTHPQAEVVAVSSRSNAGVPIADVFPNLRKKYSLTFTDADLKQLSKQADLIFLALPHNEAASQVSSEVLQAARIIDLSADFRLRDPALYDQWYHFKHANPSLLETAVYGLCELNAEAIKPARLIANPGCYATCSILALIPLLEKDLVQADTLIIDAKSGVSGSGRGLSLSSHFNESNESLKAYAVASHRHTPEIEQELGSHCGKQIKLNFTPHLIPMNRGILVTAYASLQKGADLPAIQAAYSDAYANCQFIRLYDPLNNPGVLPETRWVTASNYCDIGFQIDKRTNRIIVVAALDNLVKGAAGQAIQNMNLLYGLDEATGLDHVPVFP